MSESFRIFSPVITSDGLTEYRLIGDGVEYEVGGKRFTRLNLWEEADGSDLLFWSDMDPPSLPLAANRDSSEDE
ncbi:hypothetical protein [Pseudogemmobacter humi]|uniref:Uncharacterized protein n=1 Tax=Pseudogemmobacter humi TaxID=2483812 RepID=A0A3P5XGV7_9RHOB|nr:hypothetical protein [Pseudogemmobacter humi]VDC34039.1 hypothetical protein XINFAN_04237 [Pseudogemmobacter humi]